MMKVRAILCAVLLAGTLALTTACGTQTQTVGRVENVEYTKVSDKGVSLPKELSETDTQYAPFPVAVNGDLYFYTMLPYRSLETRANVYGNLEEVPAADYRIYKVNKEGVFVSEQTFVADGVDKETLKQVTGSSLGGFTQSGKDLYWYNEVYKTVYRYDTAAQKIESLPIQNVVNFFVLDDVVFYQPYDPSSLPDKEEFASETGSGDSGDGDGEKFIEVYAYGIESNLPWRKYENGMSKAAFPDKKGKPVGSFHFDLYYVTEDGKMIRRYNVQTGEDTEFKESFVNPLNDRVFFIDDTNWVVEQNGNYIVYDVTKETPQGKEFSDGENEMILCVGNGKLFTISDNTGHSRIYSYDLTTGKQTKICEGVYGLGGAVDETWLYYLDEEENLWRVPQDGSKEPEEILHLRDGEAVELTE